MVLCGKSAVEGNVLDESSTPFRGFSGPCRRQNRQIEAPGFGSEALLKNLVFASIWAEAVHKTTPLATLSDDMQVSRTMFGVGA